MPVGREAGEASALIKTSCEEVTLMLPYPAIPRSLMASPRSPTSASRPVRQASPQALISHGVDSELVIYPGEGHGVSRLPAVTDYLTRLVTWFDK
jgi:hypothetical protein